MKKRSRFFPRVQAFLDLALTLVLGEDCLATSCCYAPPATSSRPSSTTATLTELTGHARGPVARGLISLRKAGFRIPCW